MKKVIIVLFVFVFIYSCITSALSEGESQKYEKAISLYTKGKYDDAINMFSEIENYMDSSKYIMYIRAKELAEDQSFNLAISSFNALGDFLDSSLCAIYYTGRQAETEKDFSRAVQIYSEIAGFKDSLERINDMPDVELEWKFQQAQSGIGVREASTIYNEFLYLAQQKYSNDELKMLDDIYSAAEKAKDNKLYVTAYYIYLVLDDYGYKDSNKKAEECLYYSSIELIQAGDYEEAYNNLNKISDYPGVQKAINECLYQFAIQYEESEEYEKSFELYIQLGEYKDCASRAEHYIIDYTTAEEEQNRKNYDTAIKLFKSLGNYSDSQTRVLESYYLQGADCYEKTEYSESITAYKNAGEYLDSNERLKEAYYYYAIDLMNKHEYDKASEAFICAADYSDAAERIYEPYYYGAELLSNKGQSDEAITYYRKAISYKDSRNKIRKIYYTKATQEALFGNYKAAYLDFAKSGELKLAYDIIHLYDGSYSIYAGDCFSVGIMQNGSIVTTKRSADDIRDYGQFDIANWSDIAQIVLTDDTSFGLKQDGTILYAGLAGWGRSGVDTWNNIVSIAGGDRHIVGLRADGTVIALGDNEFHQCDVEEWNDIIAIDASKDCTAGLKADGSVITTGSYDGNTENWHDIDRIVIVDEYIFGLTNEGNVICSGIKYGSSLCNVGGWKQISDIAGNDAHLEGIKNNGKVCTTAIDGINTTNWHDVIGIAAGRNHVICLTKDGSVNATGHNGMGQLDVGQWKLTDYDHLKQRTDEYCKTNISIEDLNITTIMDDIIPDDSIWGITADSLKGSSEAEYKHCQVNQDDAWYKNNVEVGPFIMDAYYVFGEEGLYKITYILSNSDGRSGSELEQCYQTLLGEMKKREGNPNSIKNQTSIWKTDILRIELGKGKMKKYTGKDSTTVAIVFKKQR